MDSHKHLWSLPSGEKRNFFDWFGNIDMPQDTDWIVLGDFNFIRSPEDRNNLGGDINDMFIFKEAISNLGLVELPIKGINYTWSNMQQDPLLEKLYWFFTLESWTISYPLTKVSSLAKPIFIMFHVSSILELKSLKLRYSGLKTTRCSTTLLSR